MDSPIEDPRSTHCWENGRKWATATLAAAREVFDEAERCDLYVGRYYTDFGYRYPFNPWLCDRTFLFTKYNIGILEINGREDQGTRNLRILREQLEKIWNKPEDETSLKIAQELSSENNENATTSDVPEATPKAATLSVGTSTDDMIVRRGTDSMQESVEVLTQMKINVDSIVETVMTVVETAADAIEKIGEAAVLLSHSAASVDASLTTAHRQLESRDLSLERRYNEYMRVKATEGYNMLNFYLLAQDKLRDGWFLMCGDSEATQLQNIFLWVETDWKGRMRLDKEYIRAFLSERISSLRDSDPTSKKLKKLYNTFLSLRTCLVYRILCVDVLMLDNYLGRVGRSSPFPHRVENAYYELVVRRPID